jgi:hypothetical protein
VVKRRKKKRHASSGQLSLTLEELLLELGLGDLNLDRLVDLLLVPALVIGVVLDGRGEESVDEGRLAQTRLASNLEGEPCVLVYPTRSSHDHAAVTRLRTANATDNRVP